MNTKPIKMLCAASVSAVALVAVSEPSGDRPDTRHAWSVHDVNRPDPVKVEAKPGLPPGDAIVLFDGTAESVARNWCAPDGGACRWVAQDGAFVCVPGSGGAVTAEKFADCQLHVEWKTPVDDLEGWGNSGVFLMDDYEVQILDSSDVKPSRSPFKPANYADGQAGAIYGQSPCLVNPCRKTGEWQSFDIVFHPPVFEGERLVDSGSMTVFFNGVLVQDHWQLEGATDWCRRAFRHNTNGVGSVSLQDHGHPVPFRNIWIRRIPSRYANTTCGGPGVKLGDVAALRHKLAGESLAFAKATDDPAEKFIRLWESYCYEPDREVRKLLQPAANAVVVAVQAGDERVVGRRRINPMKRFVKMLVKDGWMKPGSELEKTLDAWQDAPKKTNDHMRDL